MKKLIYILIVIDIVSISIGFFMLISSSVFYSLLFVSFGILNIVPLFAIVSCLDSCERNTYDISYLYTKLKKLEKTAEEVIPAYSVAVKHNDSPKKSWKCLKCDTVNKPEDNVCTNCKTEYSYLNTTYDNNPKRKSRFVKF